MFLTRFVTICSVCLMIALGSCSKDEATAPSDNNNNNEELGKTSLSATIDGSSWSGYFVSASKIGDKVSVGGTSASGFLDFTMKSGLSTGTYTSDNDENGLEIDYSKVVGTSLENWSSSGGGSVSTTITKSNSKEIEGTFSGTLVNNGSGKSSVTNGRFYINLTEK